MKEILLEVCAGSVEDCQLAQEHRADRIELNNGLFLGGLTPSIATLIKAKEITSIPIMSMVRPRGGGFCYNKAEIETMFLDAEYLIKYGTDGIVFGFLNEDATINKEHTKKMVELCHQHNVEAVFHRAFDCVKDIEAAIQVLIDCNVDRILTSGLKNTVEEGAETLALLQKKYGDQIELVMGSGIKSENAIDVVAKTKIYQIHASFKEWYYDPTTSSENVSYAYSNSGSYEGVGEEKLKTMKEVLENVRN